MYSVLNYYVIYVQLCYVCIFAFSYLWLLTLSYLFMPQLLLRDRVEVVASVFERKPTYFFMDPFFIPLAKTKNWKNPESYVKLHNFYCDYGSAEVGPTINNVDFIFLPTCVTDNHCILFVFSVKTWGVVILDPLYDNASYPEEE